MIRGGIRVAVQHKLWNKQVVDAVQEVLMQEKVMSIPTSEWSRDEKLPRQLASTTHDTVLGDLTEAKKMDGPIGRCLVAKQDIPKNTVVLPVDGIVMKKPNTWTIQISSDDHLFSVGGSQLCAHSCNPSMFLLFDYNNSREYLGSDASLPSLYFVTKRDIRKGELLTFDYNTSEWSIVDTFNDKDTSRRIEGFSKIEDQEYRMQLLPYITPPIVELAKKHKLHLPTEEVAGLLCRTL